MFESLSTKLSKVFDSLKGKRVLRTDDVDAALREVRVSLLEADVSLSVVKEFIADVREKAVGEDVLKNVSPADTVVKIVHDCLIEILGKEFVPLQVEKKLTVIMLCGLQGAGKTTTVGKIGHMLSSSKRVYCASLDVYRPAAAEQLRTVTEGIQATYIETTGNKPVQRARYALDEAKRANADVLLLDTAGRLQIDTDLMDELVAIKKYVDPTEILLVTDAMMGQEAVSVARAFHEALNLTGIIMTRMEGDGRSGAALSMAKVAGVSIRFMGTGEGIEAFEPFHPNRLAQRILGMGDIASLVEKAAEHIRAEDAEKTKNRLKKGIFDLNDFKAQMTQLQKMGGFMSVMKFLPGAGQLSSKVKGMDDVTLKKHVAIIDSMTPKERRYTKLLGGSRKKRIASGSGTQISDINALLKQYESMQKMLKKMNRLEKKGLLKDKLDQLLPS